ncbi:type IV secretion system protein [Achromobacter ruhlandii]|uniref:type IV secretion system protein n=1 Tax=Achromobacter ruhlandii TaxID=72557 RepID=UPI003B9EA3A7
MKSKALISALIGLVLNILTTGAAHAQIPTTDGASIAQGILNTELQIKEYQRQWSMLKSQSDAMTGNRGFGNMPTTDSNKYLPSSVTGIRQGSPAANDIMKSEREKGQDTSVSAMQQANDERWKRAANQRAIANQAYEGAQKRLSSLDTLTARIKETQDPKDIAELNTRIAAEQGIINGEMNKLKLIDTMTSADEKLAEQRERDVTQKVFDNNVKSMSSFK